MVLSNIFKFAIPSSAKDAVSEYDELKIYDDAFKNYFVWVKVFDDYAFAIIKSHCVFHLSVF